MANRVTEVNKELRRRGVAERLRRGNGYYYFTEGEALDWFTSSVPVCHADALTVAQWIGELETLRKQYGKAGESERMHALAVRSGFEK